MFPSLDQYRTATVSIDCLRRVKHTQLAGFTIARSHRVWAADITEIPMRRGFGNF